MPIANVTFGGSTNKNNQLQNENLSGFCNGSNKVFSLSRRYQAGSLRVFYNGIRQSQNEITETSETSFETEFIPLSGTSLTVDFYNA